MVKRKAKYPKVFIKGGKGLCIDYSDTHAPTARNIEWDDCWLDNPFLELSFTCVNIDSVVSLNTGHPTAEQRANNIIIEEQIWPSVNLKPPKY